MEQHGLKIHQTFQLKMNLPKHGNTQIQYTASFGYVEHEIHLFHTIRESSESSFNSK